MNYISERDSEHKGLFKFLHNASGVLRSFANLNGIKEKYESDTEEASGENKDAPKNTPPPRDTEIPEDFSEIVEKYGSFVYNIVRQSTRSDPEADDIVQEVFIKAWRSIGSFRGESSLSTWLGRIAINTCMDFARMRKRKQTVSLTSASGDSPEEFKEFDIPNADVSADPEASAEKSEKIRIVRNAVAALSEEQRIVIVLRDMEGYSYNEIADMLNLELGTVKSRINRARRNIKEYLTERNIFG